MRDIQVDTVALPPSVPTMHPRTSFDVGSPESAALQTAAKSKKRVHFAAPPTSLCREHDTQGVPPRVPARYTKPGRKRAYGGGENLSGVLANSSFPQGQEGMPVDTQPRTQSPPAKRQRTPQLEATRRSPSITLSEYDPERNTHSGRYPPTQGNREEEEEYEEYEEMEEGNA
jgi:hypothetical protein